MTARDMGKTLYVTDLDGTLLSSDSRVSPRSARLLGEAIRDGALFTVATARTPSTVEGLMADVACRLPFIVMTGSAIWNPSTGLFSDAVVMEPAEAGKILGILRACALPAFVYCLRDGKIHIYHTGPLSPGERRFMEERTGSRFKVFHMGSDGESDMPDPLRDVALFFCMQPAVKVAPVYEEIRESVACTPVFYRDIFDPSLGLMEIFAPGASKANALRRLKRLSGADRVVAFGDNLNDLPMLREADVAVAVANAVPEVKRAADVIIGPNTSDAVAEFILASVRGS